MNVKTPQRSTTSVLTISGQEVKKILKALSIEKSTGVDMMPPRLANWTLSQSIENSIKRVSRKCKGCLSHSRK